MFLTAIIIAATASYALLWAYLHLTQAPEEPQLLSTTVPFISPLVQMTKWGFEVYNHLWKTHPDLPIYTFRLPFGVRLYVINSTPLIQDLQRKWRTFLFRHLPARSVHYAVGASAEAVTITNADMCSETSFRATLDRLLHTSMAKGPALEIMNAEALAGLTESLDEMAHGLENGSGKRTLKMYEWIRHLILMEATDGVYGHKHNPLRGEESEKAWLTFYKQLMPFLLGVIPPWLSNREALKAREVVVQSFIRYQSEGHYTEQHGASHFIQKWTEHHMQAGIKNDDIARLHLGLLFPLVAGTIPTAFWLIYHLFSDENVLQTCREEVSKALTVEEAAETSNCTLKVNYIKTSCPTLLAVLNEVYRVHGIGTGIRVAVEDGYLADRNTGASHLIKKGGIVLIPVRVQHRLASAGWETGGKDEFPEGGEGNEDLDRFDHTRLLRNNKSSTAGGGDKRPQRHDPVAFRIFGGGKVLCPGRHFATTSVLVFAAMLILRFDVVPGSVGRDGKPCWVMPSTKNSAMAEGLEQPDEDIDIVITQRKDTVQGSWSLSFARAS